MGVRAGPGSVGWRADLARLGRFDLEHLGNVLCGHIIAAEDTQRSHCPDDRDPDAGVGQRWLGSSTLPFTGTFCPLAHLGHG